MYGATGGGGGNNNWAQYFQHQQQQQQVGNGTTTQVRPNILQNPTTQLQPASTAVQQGYLQMQQQQLLAQKLLQSQKQPTFQNALQQQQPVAGANATANYGQYSQTQGVNPFMHGAQSSTQPFQTQNPFGQQQQGYYNQQYGGNIFTQSYMSQVQMQSQPPLPPGPPPPNQPTHQQLVEQDAIRMKFIDQWTRQALEEPPPPPPPLPGDKPPAPPLPPASNVELSILSNLKSKDPMELEDNSPAPNIPGLGDLDNLVSKNSERNTGIMIPSAETDKKAVENSPDKNQTSAIILDPSTRSGGETSVQQEPPSEQNSSNTEISKIQLSSSNAISSTTHIDPVQDITTSKNEFGLPDGQLGVKSGNFPNDGQCDGSYNNNDDLKAFDIKFQDWEKDFEAWKAANSGHPDKHAYSKYMAQWNAYKQLLINQRQAILDKIKKEEEEKKEKEDFSSDVLLEPPKPKQSAAPTLNEGPKVASNDVGEAAAAPVKTPAAAPINPQPSSVAKVTPKEDPKVPMPIVQIKTGPTPKATPAPTQSAPLRNPFAVIAPRFQRSDNPIMPHPLPTQRTPIVAARPARPLMQEPILNDPKGALGGKLPPPAPLMGLRPGVPGPLLQRPRMDNQHEMQLKTPVPGIMNNFNNKGIGGPHPGMDFQPPNEFSNLVPRNMYPPGGPRPLGPEKPPLYLNKGREPSPPVERVLRQPDKKPNEVIPGNRSVGPSVGVTGENRDLRSNFIQDNPFSAPTSVANPFVAAIAAQYFPLPTQQQLRPSIAQGQPGSFNPQGQTGPGGSQNPEVVPRRMFGDQQGGFNSTLNQQESKGPMSYFQPPQGPNTNQYREEPEFMRRNLNMEDPVDALFTRNRSEPTSMDRQSGFQGFRRDDNNSAGIIDYGHGGNSDSSGLFTRERTGPSFGFQDDFNARVHDEEDDHVKDAVTFDYGHSDQVPIIANHESRDGYFEEPAKYTADDDDNEEAYNARFSGGPEEEFEHGGGGYPPNFPMDGRHMNENYPPGRDGFGPRGGPYLGEPQYDQFCPGPGPNRPGARFPGYQDEFDDNRYGPGPNHFQRRPEIEADIFPPSFGRRAPPLDLALDPDSSGPIIEAEMISSSRVIRRAPPLDSDFDQFNSVGPPTSYMSDIRRAPPRDELEELSDDLPLGDDFESLEEFDGLKETDLGQDHVKSKERPTRSRGRDKDRSRSRDKDRKRNGSRERSRRERDLSPLSRDRDRRSRDRERDKEKVRPVILREKDLPKLEKDRGRDLLERPRERERGRSRDKDKDLDRVVELKSRRREPDLLETIKDRSKEMERGRERDKERERGSRRSRSRERDRRRSRSHSPIILRRVERNSEKEVTTSRTGARSSPSSRYTTIPIENILNEPGRSKRPTRIAIVLRGLPGSGKTHAAKMIKDREIELGGSAPRILCLDDYFMTGESEKESKDPVSGKSKIQKTQVYEYEAELESRYRNDLFKAFRKTIDNGYFNFIIVDCVNDRLKHFHEMINYASARKFQVYVAELEGSVTECAIRNIHSRTKEEISNLAKNWERAPSNIIRLDLRTFLQDENVQDDVEMEDVSDIEILPEEKNEKKPEKSQSSSNKGKPTNAAAEPEVIELVDGDEEEDDPVWTPSKWETSEEKLNKLDGLARKKRSAESEEEEEAPAQSMEAWLKAHLPEDYSIRREAEPGKKRVRWADIEERRYQERARDIGPVIGVTDWNRLTDPTFGSSALTKTKFI